MANIGVSQPYFAVYANTNGTTTYTGLKKLGKAVNVDITTEGKDPEILYADNGPAECLPMFGGGTATMEIDELELDVAKDILGLRTPTGETGVIFDADSMAPYVGLGFIVKKVHNNVIKWRHRLRRSRHRRRTAATARGMDHSAARSCRCQRSASGNG